MAIQEQLLTRRATYRQVLRSRGVPSLFGLSLATVVGISLQIFALSVLVYRQTHSPLWSSVAFAAGFLPQLLGGAVLTSLADRLPVRPILIVSAAIRAASALLLAVIQLPPLLAITVVALVAIWQPLPTAVQAALVTRLLSGDSYVLGRSMFNLISSGAQLLGLALGGTVITEFGPSTTFGIAAAIQLLGLVSATMLRAPAGQPAINGRWSPGETWRGNLTLLRDRAVRRILLSWWLPTTLLVGAESLVVAYVAERGGSAAPTGLLLGAFPVGAAVGDLVVGRWLSASQRQRAVPWLFGTVGIALLPLAWHPSMPFTAGCFAVASAATAYQLGGQQAFLGAVPEQRRGLAFGLFGTGLMTGQGLGPVLSGILADRFGAGLTIALLGAGILIAAIPLARLPRPKLPRLKLPRLKLPRLKLPRLNRGGGC